MAEKFDSLEEHLEKFVENIRQLGIIVSDFQPSSQTGLNQKLNFMVTGLQDIDKCRQQLHDISVPLEVFEYIDQGRNPQLYTKECLERALAKNEQVKGKIDTMKFLSGLYEVLPSKWNVLWIPKVMDDQNALAAAWVLPAGKIPESALYF
ncbi:mediator of RNA polymerase II transcription subunit 10 isoform X1 [Onychostruthus taczanowskii]|uniref:mediator of RNA polymerase II transcription subunit 10 isoform X1 n=1 Tax=Onychostruthus taczanowskii TaxID=356909 RepID=UPI001B8064C4|nr:mediator of RNA polymerase II transcription subunit 10 isoform X1 [Onychostruthus taczanowskii]